jgi:hypothetical protein
MRGFSSCFSQASIARWFSYSGPNVFLVSHFLLGKWNMPATTLCNIIKKGVVYKEIKKKKRRQQLSTPGSINSFLNYYRGATKKKLKQNKRTLSLILSGTIHHQFTHFSYQFYLAPQLLLHPHRKM